MGPDTKRGWMPEKTCSDCGYTGCSWGSKSPNIIPEADSYGSFINFCTFCYDQRQRRAADGLDPLPLGVKLPGVPEEFSERAMTVVTEGGSKYPFGRPDKNDKRSVFSENKTKEIGFNRCQILLLKEGEGMWFRGTGVDPDMATLRTSPVLSIY